jgi:predicted MFS family arabinose efflux permease
VDVRKNESAKYLGYLHGLFGVGSLLAPLFFIWASRYIDWRGAHYALAAASILVMLFIFIMTRGMSKKGDSHVMREHIITKADLLAYIKVKRNIALALAGFFAMFLIAAVLVWIVRYITLAYYAPEIGALAFSVFWICSTANRFLLAQIIKRAPMMFFTIGALLSAVFLIIGIFSGSPIVMCVMMGLFGFCSGHFIPVLVSECATGYEGRTTFTTSIIMFVMSIARVAAPVIIAFVSTQISLTVGMLFPVAAALLSAGCGWMAFRANHKSQITNYK